MKVSGQFQNIASAENYAKIRSYVETGKRHGMNALELLKRLVSGDPVTLSEMRD